MSGPVERAGWLFAVRRPARYLDAVGVHLPGVILAGGLLLAAYLPWQRLPLRACMFLQLTGCPCPFCGYTRGFMDLAHGRWAAAWHGCPLAVALLGALLLVLGWNLAGLAGGVILGRGRLLRPGPRAARVLLALAAALVLGNWAYRIAAGLK